MPNKTYFVDKIKPTVLQCFFKNYCKSKSLHDFRESIVVANQILLYGCTCFNNTDVHKALMANITRCKSFFSGYRT